MPRAAPTKAAAVPAKSKAAPKTAAAKSAKPVAKPAPPPTKRGAKTGAGGAVKPRGKAARDVVAAAEGTVIGSRRKGAKAPKKKEEEVRTSGYPVSYNIFMASYFSFLRNICELDLNRSKIEKILCVVVAHLFASVHAFCEGFESLLHSFFYCTTYTN